MKHVATLTALCLASWSVAQTFTTWTVADGLPSNDIRDVAIAPDGSVWLATGAGVAIFAGGTFTVHNTTTHPGLANNDVFAVEVLPNGTAWVGTDFGASFYDNGVYTTYTTADGLSDDVVNAIDASPTGEIWFGTINGVSRFAGGGFTSWGPPQIPFGGVLHSAFASNGDVWLSGGLFGAIRYNGNTFTTVTTADGLLSNRIRAIAIDAQQRKWVATAEGISVLDATGQHLTDHEHVFTLPPPDELNPLTDIAVDAAGRVWAAVYVDYLVTVGGVSVYDGNAWTQFETSDGLAGPNVQALAIDASGDVWVATSTGLTRISDIEIGVEERAALPSIAVYPNPASDALWVVHEAPGTVSYEVVSANGGIVRQGNLATGRAAVDVSGLAPGLYTLRAVGAVKRFVVQR
jgi:ligand-binding sensor domain-containing protein